MPGVLLFGGSFDPIHHGHLIVVRAIAEQLRADRAVLIPSARPPHKPGRAQASAAQRAEMCRCAVADEPALTVDDWELQQTGPNYTLLTVQHYRSLLPANAELYWLLGMDSLRELSTWYHAPELIDACTLVTAARPGFAVPTATELGAHFAAAQVAKLQRFIIPSPHVDISATEIRTRVARGASIRYLTPPAVVDYIASTGLYKTCASR